MQIIPYLQENSAYSYYAPHHFKSSRSFTLDPGQTVLVTLDHHVKLDHFASRTLCGNRTVSCRFSNPDKLGMLVTNRSDKAEGIVVFIPANTYLNVLLSLQQIKSHWVTIPDDEKVEKPRGCCFPPTPPPPSEEEEEDSCTDECDHSDIDDGFIIHVD
jgi:hypothetical protein